MSYYQRYVKQYEKTPMGRFVRQKASANRRGIPWELSFDDWWGIWQESGKWEERGNKTGQFCMGRKNDIGPYSKENVMIIPSSKNSQDSWKNGLSMYTSKHIEKAHRKFRKEKEIVNHWPLNWATEEAKKNNPFLRGKPYVQTVPMLWETYKNKKYHVEA